MEIPSEEAGVRTALIKYLLVVKEFHSKLYSPAIIGKMEAFFPQSPISSSQEPLIVRLARTEKEWLNELFSCLNVIGQTMTNLENWRTWFLDLMENLEFTEQNIQKLTKGPDLVLEELRSHKLDKGYVRLIVNNGTSDFLELITETRKLLDQLVALHSFIQELQSPVLQIVEDRLDRLKDVKYPELLNQMQQLIAATYNAPGHEDFLRNLSKLLHIFGGWRQMLRLDDPELDSPEAMSTFIENTRTVVNTMIELTKAFEGFINARNLADYFVRQAELSIIRMMLTYEGRAESWWITFIEASPEQIVHIIPNQLDPHQLLIGVTHSLALLEDLENRLLPQIPSVKTTLGELGNFLQSPSIKLYEEIYQKRLMIWNRYEPQWLNALIQLRNQLHYQLKKKRTQNEMQVEG